MEPPGKDSERSKHDYQQSHRTRPPRHSRGGHSYRRSHQDSAQDASTSQKSNQSDTNKPRSSYQKNNWQSSKEGRGRGYRNREQFYRNNSDHPRIDNRYGNRRTYDDSDKLNSTSDVVHNSRLHPSSNHSSESHDPQSCDTISSENLENNAIGAVVNGRYVRKNDDVPKDSYSRSSKKQDQMINKGAISRGRNESRQYYDYNQQTSYGNSNSNVNNNNSDRHIHYTRYQRHTHQDVNQTSNRGYNKRQNNRSRYAGNKNMYDAMYEDYEDDDASFGRDFEYEDSMHSPAFTKKNFSTGSKSLSKKRNNQESTTQRDRLIRQLEKGECECMVCCECIGLRDYTWSCDNCYHIFHLKCIKKWARSPAAVMKDGGWRCPACQKITESIPYTYYCFCGKKKDPEINPHYTPHSCGEMCGRKREDENCVHKCNLLCHPGPCPSCMATVNRSCECGKSSKMVSCGQSDPVLCTDVCGKVLNCGVHTCDQICHKGACNPCHITLKQECFCRASKREILCDEVTSGQDHYSCGMVCSRALECGNHNCSSTCHPGPCGPCLLLPEYVTTCPCRKTTIEDLYNAGKANKRVLCTDAIPSCGQKCEKELSCGPKDDHHKCSSDCHNGPCPPCSLTTVVKCQCCSTSKEISCKDLTIPHVLKCEKRCNKRKNCGRHKCLNTCCTIKNHVCELVCNKKLSCGSHQCQEPCHAGNCPTCWNVSFDELRCHCGHSVLYPPIHCGTHPPECDQPCTRSHSCDHKVQHTCNSDPTCPPCTVLVDKMCFGNHEKRTNVQCFLDGISCGKPCGKPLPCGNHKCKETCHSGACLKSEASCVQPCETLRSCSHPCNAPCHTGPCPDTLCKAKVNVTCPCGFRSESATCSEDISTYRLVSLSRMAAKMNDIKSGESVDIGDIFGKKNKYNRLLCNEDCAIHERNKRLAVALQIQNPDLSCKPGPPNYSDFLKEEAKKNFKFVSGVYDKFVELVQLAKQSKQKSRSFAFPPMNRDQRRVIHEMAEFFGCETQSYDEEPVKNVVITAFRDRSWLPFVSISTVVEREKGLRRGPAPIINSASKVPVQVSTAEKKSKAIDYFDYEG